MNSSFRRWSAAVLVASTLLAACAEQPHSPAQVPTPFPTFAVDATPTDAPPPLTTGALLDALRSGGYVVFVRHAPSAPMPNNGAANAPAATATAQCQTQSTLTDEGRAAAQQIGEAFQALGIPVAQVRSSPACRTLETAQLAFGSAQEDPALSALSAEQNAADRDRLVNALRQLLAAAPPPGSNTVLSDTTRTYGKLPAWSRIKAKPWCSSHWAAINGTLWAASSATDGRTSHRLPCLPAPSPTPPTGVQRAPAARYWHAVGTKGCCMERACCIYLINTARSYHQHRQRAQGTCMSRIAHCQRCETLEHPLAGPGTLHLRLPLAHSLGKVLHHLEYAAWRYTHQHGMLSIAAPGADLGTVLLPLMRILTPAEQADARALFQPDGKSMSLRDYFEMTSLQQLFAKVQGGWLVDLLRAERLSMMFQPIVRRDEPQQVFAYECLLRGIEHNQLVYPDRLLAVARGADLLFQLDLAARRTAIREAVRHNITAKLFINFTPSAIYDPAFCLRSTVRALDEANIAPERVVFEVIESDHIADPDHLRRICDFYRERGFGIALDDIGSGYASLRMLNDLRPDYIKIDMHLVRNIDRDPYKALITQKLLETAQGLGITTIAEGVETADEYAWVVQHGADLIQGYYIAKPASPPPLPLLHAAALPA